MLALPTWVEHAPHLAASTGLSRGKTDQADARRIAAYAARFVDRARLWTAPACGARPGRCWPSSTGSAPVGRGW